MDPRQKTSQWTVRRWEMYRIWIVFYFRSTRLISLESLSTERELCWAGFYLWVKLGSKISWLQSCLGKTEIYSLKLTITLNRNEYNKTTFSKAGAYNKTDPNIFLPQSSAELDLQPHRPGTTFYRYREFKNHVSSQLN